jgi:hypothetical protein
LSPATAGQYNPTVFPNTSQFPVPSLERY